VVSLRRLTKRAAACRQRRRVQPGRAHGLQRQGGRLRARRVAAGRCGGRRHRRAHRHGPLATESGGSSNTLGGSAYATPPPTPTASGGAASGILANSNTLASPTGLGSSGTGASTTSSGSILGSGTLGTGTMLGTGALGTSGGLPVEHLYSLPGAASGISSRAPPPALAPAPLPSAQHALLRVLRCLHAPACAHNLPGAPLASQA